MNLGLNKKNILLILAIIFVLGLFLRLHNLGVASIRGDEGGTIYLSERPVVDIFTKPQDVQPPLFYGLLHFWIKIFGKSTFALRLLPALLSALAIPLIFALGKSIFDEKIGLFAAFVFAISQANIRFAQNLRMYSLLLLFALLSVYFLNEYFKNPGKKYIVLYAVSASLAVYSHYFAGFLLIAEFLYAIFFYKKYNLKFLDVFSMFVLAGIIILPLLPTFYSQYLIKSVAEQTFIADDPLLKVSFTALGQNNIFARLALIFYHFSVGFLLFNPRSAVFLAVFVPAIIIFTSTIFASVKKLLGSAKEKLIFLLFLLIIPTAALAVVWVLKILPAQTYTRYLLYLSPIYYILVGYGVIEGLDGIVHSANAKKLLLPIILIAIIFFNAITLNYYYRLDSQQQDWESFVSDIKKDYKDGDLVFLYTASYFYDLNYYLSGANVYTPPQNILLDNLNLAEVYNSIIKINEANACDVLKIANENAKSIWVIRVAMDRNDAALRHLSNCFVNNGFSLKTAIENAYADQKGDNLTDLIAYHFTK